MEDFLFMVIHLFTIFDSDKAVTLVFDLGSVEEATNTEEAGLFCHYYVNLFNHFSMCGLNAQINKV
ncbi:hypothetical protein A9J31_09685 [Acinetobacter gandensis]|uniref:Uncharacterized protein n=1 Tax=Acinetobacter gandensis TaxID=1443941 RepID=A0A1A7R6J7_9GAMM|nr:hypothetical protein A9J31_09685 [Acinetobacter gandensis]